jgi:FlaA1/EpsC-like NDP-sugar epimerase
MILMASGVAYVGFVVVRYRSRLIQGLVGRWLSVRGHAIEAKERVLIIGGGEAGQFMAWLLHSGSGSEAFRAVGIVDDDLYKQGTRIQGLPVLGRRTDIPQLVKKHDAGIIVFAIHNIPIQERRQVLDICGTTPARVVAMPDIIGTLKSIVKLDGPEETGSWISQGDRFSTSPNDQKSEALQQFDQWLADIDDSVQSGDLQSAREKIQSYRNHINTQDIE